MGPFSLLLPHVLQICLAFRLSIPLFFGLFLVKALLNEDVMISKILRFSRYSIYGYLKERLDFSYSAVQTYIAESSWIIQTPNDPRSPSQTLPQPTYPLVPLNWQPWPSLSLESTQIYLTSRA